MTMIDDTLQILVFVEFLLFSTFPDVLTIDPERTEDDLRLLVVDL